MTTDTKKDEILFCGYLNPQNRRSLLGMNPPEIRAKDGKMV
jgi:hypothetical protein